MSAGTRAHVEELLDALRACAAAAEVAGPLHLPGRVVEHLRHLDPEHLTTSHLAVLLETLGVDPWGGPSPLLDALVDAVPPPLRAAIAGRLADLRTTPVRA